MGLGHEKLDVYRLSIGYVAWVFEKVDSQERKIALDRIAVMLSRLGGRGYQVKEDSAPYASEGDPDFDSDFDSDFEEKGSLS